MILESPHFAIQHKFILHSTNQRGSDGLLGFKWFSVIKAKKALLQCPLSQLYKDICHLPPCLRPAGSSWARPWGHRRSQRLSGIVTGSGAEINLPGAPCAADGNESLHFNLLSEKSCMGGGWLGRENQNSSAWPLSREMLGAEPGIALAPTRGGCQKLCCLSIYNMQQVRIRSHLEEGRKETSSGVVSHYFLFFGS